MFLSFTPPPTHTLSRVCVRAYTYVRTHTFIAKGKLFKKTREINLNVIKTLKKAGMKLLNTRKRTIKQFQQ